MATLYGRRQTTLRSRNPEGVGVASVPIVLEACQWEKTKLGALNALPEKAKPLSQWTRASDAWKAVADGLAAGGFAQAREAPAQRRVAKQRPPTLQGRRPPLA